MNYKEKLKLMLDVHSDEVWPGEKAEIVSMTNTAGCDISEHVPTLIEYGMKVNTITEMGVRFGFSTRAFLYSRPRSLNSVDLFEWNSKEHTGSDPRTNNFWATEFKQRYGGITDFNFLLGDSTKIPIIDEVDLLFIDTFHHKDVLEIELERHGNQAQKYIIMHDTTTFGNQGQACDALLFVDHVTTNEIGTGLNFAINKFLSDNPHWVIKEIYTNNNGLTILERVS